MERSHRPPPLNLTPPASARNSTQQHSRSKSNQSRLSRFAESFQGYMATPLRSMFEHDDDKWNTSCAVTLVRVVSDFLHILTSMLLLLIMAFFLDYCDHNPAVATLSTGTGPQALALILLLGLDILLDFQSIGRYDQKWHGWALVARLLFGVAYMTVLATYAAVGGAFPPRYTYWGMAQQFASPITYMFLCILAVWNLVYVAICRHRFASEAKRYGRRVGVAGRARKERHDNMAHVDVEAGFKQMSNIVGHEKSLSVSTVSSTTMPKLAVIRP